MELCCTYCHKQLAGRKTIVSASGMLYCDNDCVRDHFDQRFKYDMPNDGMTADEYVEMFSEEIDPISIGITKTEELYCAKCGKKIDKWVHMSRLGREVFCSKECTVDYQMDVIIKTAKETAEEYYVNQADSILVSNIGRCAKCKEPLEYKELTSTELGPLCETCLERAHLNGELK